VFELSIYRHPMLVALALPLDAQADFLVDVSAVLFQVLIGGVALRPTHEGYVDAGFVSAERPYPRCDPTQTLRRNTEVPVGHAGPVLRDRLGLIIEPKLLQKLPPELDARRLVGIDGRG